MKLKHILILILMASNAVFAENSAQTSSPQPTAETPTFSGKPLNSKIPTNIENSLPDLGDVSQTVLTPQDEQRIGEQILRQVAVSDDVLQDAEVTDYLQALGNRLAIASADTRQKFTFFVVRDNTINAFAMPGGVIGVHTGLILASNRESELASVLGHEIGHVTQRHLARMLAKQKTDTFKNIGSMALALLVARANPELATGALATASASSIQRQLDYTREHEREADRVGLNVLDAAGFDVRGMPAFFTTLQRGTRFAEGSAPSFLRTHPLNAERIADVVDSLEFSLVRAKLRAGDGLAQTAIDQFEDNIKERRFTNEISEHYGLALAMLRKNDILGATTEVKWLKSNAPKNAFIENLAARLEVSKNNPQAAANQYAKALAQFPNHRSLIYGYAEHFLASNQPDKAIQLVQQIQALYPEDAYFYDVLAKAYTVKNKSMLRFQAQAESYYRKYNLKKAIEQMEFATKAKDGNFYEHSIVDARLKEFKRMLETEKLADERLG
jgi:beta-barrel assembly-enhancing protease